MFLIEDNNPVPVTNIYNYIQPVYFTSTTVNYVMTDKFVLPELCKTVYADLESNEEFWSEMSG
jgi:hypothetical protein